MENKQFLKKKKKRKKERKPVQCRRPGFDSWVGKMPWRRAWQPTAVPWPAESQGHRSLAGLQRMGSQGVGHDRAHTPGMETDVCLGQPAPSSSPETSYRCQMASSDDLRCGCPAGLLALGVFTLLDFPSGVLRLHTWRPASERAEQAGPPSRTAGQLLCRLERRHPRPSFGGGGGREVTPVRSETLGERRRI